jgi:hypothetical protein
LLASILASELPAGAGILFMSHSLIADKKIIIYCECRIRKKVEVKKSAPGIIPIQQYNTPITRANISLSETIYTEEAQ